MTFNLMIFVIFFAFMVAIKGGLIGHIAKWFGKEDQWKKFQKMNFVFDFISEGKFISAVLSGVFIGFHSGWLVGLLFAVAWWLGWVMSLGEEIGAIGRLGHNWGDYVEWLGSKEGRKFGWKKGLHRGVFLGACLVLATYSIPHNEIIVIACALFPAIYFLGNEIYYRVNKSDSWFYSEFLYGALIGAFLNLIL